MKIVAEIVAVMILLASWVLMAQNQISEFRIETFIKVNEGLSSLEVFTIELTK